MVERGAVGHSAAPVMADDRERVGAQFGGERDDVGGHLALREALAGRASGGCCRRSVAAQVGEDHTVRTRQGRRDLRPAVVGLRIAVEKDQRGSIAADGHLVRGVADCVSSVVETVHYG